MKMQCFYRAIGKINTTLKYVITIGIQNDNYVVLLLLTLGTSTSVFPVHTNNIDIDIKISVYM